MQPVVRKTSVWAFSALFGCISLLGQGWHCFVGHAFHPCAHDHARASACHDHGGAEGSCQHACRSPLGESFGGPQSNRSHDEGHHGAIDLAAHDCPLCQFFAQAQWASSLGPCLLVLFSCEVPVAGEPLVGPPAHGVYDSRGPPCGPAFC